MLAVAYPSGPARADTNVDPAGSPLWPMIQQEVFGATRTTFGSRVRITESAFARDAIQVPVVFGILALGKVERIVVVVDRNPVRKVLEFTLIHARPALSFRLKLQGASAACMAACMLDGVWYVSALQMDVTGGGCTLPNAARQNATRDTALNQIEPCVFPDFNGVGSRIRLHVMYPMGTGLVAGIPSFYIEQLNLLDARRQFVLELALYEPVTENSIFSLDLGGPVGRGTSVIGIDNNGNRTRAQVTR